MLPVEQGLFPPYGAPEFRSIFSGDRVAQSLVFSLQYLVDYVSSCCHFPLHIEFSVIFALRLPITSLVYLQTFLKNNTSCR